MIQIKIVGKPAVSKTEILYSGPEEIIRQFRDKLPAGKAGDIASSPIPGFEYSLFIYGHSIELEKNIQIQFEKIARENAVSVSAPVPPPAPASRAGLWAGIAAAAAAVLLGGFFFLRAPASDRASIEGEGTYSAEHQPGKKKHKKKKQSAGGKTPKVLAQYTAPSAVPADSRFRLDMVDVKQGDAMLVYFPSGKTMLIDGGDNKGKAKLMKHLEAADLQRIDILVMTHPHLDHMAAFDEIIDRYEIGEVYEPAYDHTTATYSKFLRAVNDKGIPYHQAKNGMEIGVGDGVRVMVLSPPDPFLSNTRSDVNNSSIVLRMQHGDIVFLLTGDIEAEIEDWLVEQDGAVDATVLKAPHHGGAHSSQESFLDAVSPEVVIISCGEGNSYGHPAPGTLLRYQKAGAKIYRTDNDGSITITSDGRGIRVETENRGGPT